jgi:hypothetical protein
VDERRETHSVSAENRNRVKVIARHDPKVENQIARSDAIFPCGYGRVVIRQVQVQECLTLVLIRWRKCAVEYLVAKLNELRDFSQVPLMALKVSLLRL